MASNFISYTKHGVAESTLLKATKVGHHYNLVNESKDIDNGSVAVIIIINSHMSLFIFLPKS